MNERHLFHFLIFLFLPILAAAQDNSDIDLNHLIEIVFDEPDDANLDSIERFRQSMEALLNNPIDLNNCRVSELLSLPFLDLRTANRICSSLASQPDIMTHISLRYLFDEEDHFYYFSLLTAFRDRNGLLPERIELRSQFGSDLHQRKGNRLGKYAGNRVYSKFRVNMQSGAGTEYSLLSEKDAGEALDFGSNRLIFDHVSASIRHPLNETTHLIAGDYQVRIGSGLVLGGSSFSSLTKPIRIGRSVSSAKSYSSSDENQAMRGAAISTKLGPLHLIGGISRRRIDATMDYSSNGNPIIKSFGKSGLHRTVGEASRKDLALHSNSTMSLSYEKWGNKKHIALGLSTLQGSWSAPFATSIRDDLSSIPESSNYKLLQVTGKALWNWFAIQGDAAQSSNSQRAYLIGGRFSSKYFKTSGQFRDYQAGFFSPFASSHDRHGLASNNEKGYRANFGMRLPLAIRLEAGLDSYRTLDPIFFSDFPVEGLRKAVQLERKWKQKSSIRLRRQSRLLIENLAAKREAYVSDDLKIRLQIHDKLNLKTHYSRSHFEEDIPSTDSESSKSHSRGWAISQDLEWRSSGLRVLFGTKFFKTDNYDARIYHYESNVSDYFYIPALSGKGRRYSLLLSRSFKSNLGAEFKWSMWHYDDRDKVSSGNQEIEGNLHSNIRFQMALTL